MKTKISYLLILLPFLSLLFFGFKGDDKKRTGKINVNDVYEFIAINNILMWVSNNGDGSHDPRTDGNGLYWPGGLNATKSAVFQDGLLFGGKVGSQIRVNGNAHRQGLQAGKIINGTPDDPSLEKYRVYKINKNWRSLPPGPERDAREKDYNEWPIEDGAPYVDVDGDGKPTPGVDEPDFIGDEVLWYVANDMDPNRSTFTYGTNPMGLEFQTTIFGFDKLNPLGDMVFKKYKIINKGNITVKDMILAYWSDTDLGDAADDFSGCDTIINLGYTWNGTNNDGTYGTPPPAMGYVFVQGPAIKTGAEDSAKFDGRWRYGYRNLPITAFAVFLPSLRDPPQGVPQASIEMYNFMRGYVWDGSPFINPHTGDETRFVVSGDPETGTGWYEGTGWPSGPPPGDRRHLMSSGSFNFAPGDTQEIVVALIMAEGNNHRNSVTVLKEMSAIAQIAYDNDFKISALPDKPRVHAVPQNKAITLWWETNAENFSLFDPLIPDIIRLTFGETKYVIPVNEKDYNFEGYRVWQFKDKEGRDPVLLAVYDIENGISAIRDYTYEYALINGGTINQDPLINGHDQGLKRFFNITTDAYTGELLYNGSPYYFGITSYAYSKFSDPPAIESQPEIIEVIPGTSPIDVVSPYKNGDIVTAQQVSGSGDGSIKIRIIDPAALTGHDYRVEINGSLENNNIRFSLFDVTLNKVLIDNSREFNTDFDSKPVTDGFQLTVQNMGLDSINGQMPATERFMVKDVLEIKGPGGTELETPLSVFNQSNSTGEWKIIAPGQNPALKLDTIDTRQNIDWTNNLGYNDYEIRFTLSGSEYYITGFTGARPPFVNNPQGAGRVPFEIWNVRGYNPDTSGAIQQYIKIWDASIRDSMWTQNPVTLEWEAIFSYEDSTLQYREPIPPTSGAVTSDQHKLGNIIIRGNRPATGTVIKVVTFKPISEGDEFIFKAEAPQINNETAKQNIDNISVFPNPYYGANAAIGDYPPYIRFTNLPEKVSIRIFSLAGVYINKIEKDEAGQYIDWDLTNKDGYTVASGIYLAYIEFPGIGNKIMKIAVAR